MRSISSNRLGAVSEITLLIPLILIKNIHNFRNLFILAERFEADFKSQLSTCLDKEALQPENCHIRMTMGNIYEKILFFLNHMTHSFIDYSRSESPMSASNYDCQSVASGGTAALQRFRLLQQQQFAQQYRRWSEAAATMEHNEANVDSNRRWSMPTNVSKTRLNVIPKTTLAGLVSQQSQQQTQIQQQQQNQSTNLDPSSNDGGNEWIAIQLLSFRPPLPSRPPSQVQHCTTQIPSQNYQYSTATARNTQPPQQQQQTRQRPRGDLNEILILPRPNDPIFLGRCQQIAENIRGESDEY